MQFPRFLLLLFCSTAAAAAPPADKFSPGRWGMERLEPVMPRPLYTTPPVMPEHEWKGVEPINTTLGRAREVELRAGCRLISHGCKVTSSSPPQRGELEFVTDGDRSGEDGHGVELPAGRQWVRIDLGEVREVHGLWVWRYHRMPVVFRGVKIELAENEAGPWTTLWSTEPDARGKRSAPLHYETFSGFPFVPLTPPLARFVRLWSEGADKLPENHYVEIAVYGRNPGTLPRDYFRPMGTKKVKLEPEMPKPLWSTPPTPRPDWPGVKVDFDSWKLYQNVVIGEGCRVLSHHCPVKLSDADALGDPQLVTDGKRSSESDAVVDMAPGKQWVLIDLGTSREIHCVWLWLDHRLAWLSYHDVIVQITDQPDAPGAPGTVTVLNTDTDGSSGMGKGTDAGWVEDINGRPITIAPAKGRYVKVWTNGRTSDDTNVFTEIAVYGKDVTPEHGTVRPEVRRLLPDSFWSTDPLDRILPGGSAIGGAGAPSAFYTAAVEALDKGGVGEREFLELTRHPHFPVRIVGMAGLAREGSGFGIDRLKQLLSSREGEDGYPGGDGTARIYESAVAWHFLAETGYLCCRRTTPLLPEKEAIALALDVLARDECAGAREPEWDSQESGPVARFLAGKITSGKLTLNLPGLRAAAPGMQIHQLIKAAGRLPAQLCTPFLIEMLHAPDVIPPYHKLAAASALARNSYHTPGRLEHDAFVAATKSLNDKLNHEPWGDRFSSLYSLSWERLPTRWPEQKLDSVSDADYQEFLLPVWTSWALNAPRRTDARPVCSSWVTLAAALEDSDWVRAQLARQDWSAFRDTLYRLELKARFLGQYDAREIEPEPARVAVLSALRPILPGPVVGGDPTDNAELIWRIHDRIAATPAPTDAAQMQPYTGTVPRAKDFPYHMVPIPAGDFLLGSPDKEKDRKPDEGPQVKVHIEPFWMSTCEVTWDAFLPFMLTPAARWRDGTLKNPQPGLPEADAVSSPTAPYTDMTFGMGQEGYPAISMTQHSALKFCQWLSAQTGHFYRLPTEAEWEYAARAGTTTAYFWGDDPAALGEYAWFFENSAVSNLETTNPVGQKKPNPWGLYDIYGNVAEWTLDQYDPGWYATLTTPESRANPFHIPATLYPRTVRGGSFDDDPHHCRSAARRGSTPNWQAQDVEIPKSIWYLTNAQFLGFRIVRPLKVPSAEEMHMIWNLGVVGEER
jgi:formylglycine-generating enzyme required for sulfatase activity